MKLWIFGSSNCLPWKLEDPADSWMVKLADKLGCDLENHAQEACDNLYIYHKIVEQAHNISNNDFVVVGWTHPNRKTWVEDPDNLEHVKLLQDLDTLVYAGKPNFFRAYNNSQPNWFHWSTLKPLTNGRRFFDQWFKNYYSRLEQDLNMQSYLDSAQQRLPKNTLFFFFSKESLTGLHPVPAGFCYLDFIAENQLALSANDMHSGTTGHEIIANIFHKDLTLT